MGSWKKTIRMLTVLGALLLLCVGTASAASIGVGTVDADGGLRLRAEANTDSTILNTAYTGDVVMVLEEAGNGWYKVDSKSVEGYMSGEYLNIETTVEMDLGYGKVDVDSILNVRSGPGTDFDKVGSLAARTVVKITGMENGWYHIAYGEDKTGYVSSEYLVPCLNENGNRGDDPGAADLTALEAQIVEEALKYVGVPYVWGGASPRGFDCSGFTMYIYAKFGYSMPHGASSQQRTLTTKVSKDELRPGDLVFFHKKGSKYLADHVGIYLGNDQFINASSNTDTVIIETLSSKKNFSAARRVLSE